MIVGHERQVALLREGLAASTLLIGPHGVGKWTTACEIANEASHPADVTLVEKLTTEAARDVIATASVAPMASAHRTVVIDLDGATESAQHALLKILEEPPDVARMILTSCTAPLDTVRSRCRTIRFGTLSVLDVATVLCSLGLPPGEADALAATSGGMPAAALRLRSAYAEKPRVLSLLRAVAQRHWVMVGQVLRGADEDARWSADSLTALRLFLADVLADTETFYARNERYGLDRSTPRQSLLRAFEAASMPTRPSLAVSLAAQALMAR